MGAAINDAGSSPDVVTIISSTGCLVDLYRIIMITPKIRKMLNQKRLTKKRNQEDGY